MEIALSLDDQPFMQSNVHSREKYNPMPASKFLSLKDCNEFLHGEARHSVKFSFVFNKFAMNTRCEMHNKRFHK